MTGYVSDKHVLLFICPCVHSLSFEVITCLEVSDMNLLIYIRFIMGEMRTNTNRKCKGPVIFLEV